MIVYAYNFITDSCSFSAFKFYFNLRYQSEEKIWHFIKINGKKTK